MEKALDIQKKVSEILGTDEVYLVGGSVRDIVLGKEPKDYDFCTPLLPDDVEELVKKSGMRAYGIGKKFGTIGFKVPYQQEKPKDVLSTNDSAFMVKYEYVEVTTFRSEVYTSKSRKPEVKFIPNLDEDLARRDFSMNAMVLRLDGEIYDPFGGRVDILDKQIRTVGLPKDRIQEDPLRMLRAARFASQLGFWVDPNMVGKMRQIGYRITDVSKERWVLELDKMLSSNNVELGLQVLMQSELMKYVLPEVYLSLIDHDVESVVGEIKEAKTVDEKWAALFFYIGHPYTEKLKKDEFTYPNYEVVRRELLQGICQRLKFSNERRDFLLKK